MTLYTILLLNEPLLSKKSTDIEERSWIEQQEEIEYFSPNGVAFWKHKGNNIIWSLFDPPLLVFELQVLVLELFPFHFGDLLDTLYHCLFGLSDVFGLFLHEQDLALQPASSLDGLELGLVICVSVLVCDLFLVIIFHLSKDY